MAFIQHISTYIPEKVISNEEISAKFPDWDSDKILEKIGIRNRNITGDDEFTSDIAVKALNKLIDEYQLDKSSIDYLIVCTQSPDYFLPATACIVQAQAGLNTSCGAIDINQGCSGYIYGLSLANALIDSKMMKNVVLITAETYSKHIHEDDKGNISLFGDAATATLISDNGDYEILKFSVGTDGEGAKNLIVKNGAVRNKKTDDSEDKDNYLHMNGPKIFDFTSKAIPGLVQENLKLNGFEKSDIDTFIFHQANTFMLEFLRKRINIPQENFVIDMLDYGNTVSSTIPIAFKNSLTTRELKNIMLVGFGVGYSWGAVCLRKNN
ncbi:3-oxoacyl-[acyl-carrier-protein] synthase-3 [Chryseobacterium sp. 52]|uniref:3-oxoacyl-ACP synthase III family protein n=1 Tax=Chryseobacterium sp. 52 TaxID=2035213 RepID=UPI000C19E3D5|nr:ketoacyl-ACP synthase III [Chryseobacterium sp. 52]PIF43408.1 3-oxoacyl-[acyl-carrier-protein] synthase-3 [Chryseobacterium sp. 52]